MCNVKMEALKVFLDRWSKNNSNFFFLFKKTVQGNKTRFKDLKYLYNYALVTMPFRPDGLSFLESGSIQVSGAYMWFLKLHVFLQGIILGLHFVSVCLIVPTFPRLASNMLWMEWN